MPILNIYKGEIITIMISIYSSTYAYDWRGEQAPGKELQENNDQCMVDAGLSKPRLGTQSKAQNYELEKMIHFLEVSYIHSRFLEHKHL